MARIRSRARVSRGTAPRRKWIWARHDVIETPLAASGALFSDLLSEFETAYGADLLGCTIMRIRGELKASQSVLAAARIWDVPTDGVSRLAVATDSPANVPHQDWFVWQPMFLDVTTGVRVMEIDVKAARKLEELDQGLLWSVHNYSGSAATVSWNLSIGVKLP